MIIIVVGLIVGIVINNQNKHKHKRNYEKQLAVYDFSIINTISNIADEFTLVDNVNFEYLHVNSIKATSFTMKDRVWNKSLFMLYINVNNVPFTISNNSIKSTNSLNILVKNKPISTFLYNNMILNQNIPNKKYLVINKNNTTSPTTVNYTNDMSYILFQDSNYDQLTISTDNLSDLLLVFYNTTINNMSIKLNLNPITTKSVTTKSVTTKSVTTKST